MGDEGLMEILEHGSVLPGAGGGGSPDALAPASAALAARALGHVAVLDHEAGGLLGQVVRGFGARRGDEAEKCNKDRSPAPATAPHTQPLANTPAPVQRGPS